MATKTKSKKQDAGSLSLVPRIVTVDRHMYLTCVLPVDPAQLSNEDVAKLLSASKSVKKCLDDLDATAKERIGSGEDVPGWTLEPTAGDRKIFDVPEAWKRLSDEGVTVGRLLGCVDMPIGRIESLWIEHYQHKHPGAGKEEAKASFMKILGELMKRTTKKPHLKRIF